MHVIYADIENLKLFRRALGAFVGNQGDILDEVTYETERVYTSLLETEDRCREEIVRIGGDLLLRYGGPLLASYINTEFFFPEEAQVCLEGISNEASYATGDSLMNEMNSLFDMVPVISDIKKFKDLLHAIDYLRKIQKSQKTG